MSKMAGNFKVGDLVWAKMKGFPNWPGKVIAPKPEVKRPANKKNQQFVFFFGSENYAWIQEENMHIYADNRNRFMLSQRIPRGYKEAIEAIEDALKACPEDVNLKTSDLPSIEEELAQIFPARKDAPHRDYSRDSGRKRKKSPPPHPAPTKAKTPKDRRSQAPPASIRDRRRSSHDDQKKNGKSSTSGVRAGKDATPAGKEASKTKKIDRVSTPKVLPKSSTKVLHKSAKKVRKVKNDNSESPESTKSESTVKSEIANDSDATKAKDSNHTEGDNVEPGDFPEEAEEVPEPQESDGKVNEEERSASPELFGSEIDGEANDSRNQNGNGPVENEVDQKATSDIMAVEEEVNECSAGPSSFGVDADDPPQEPAPEEKSPPPPTPPPVVITPKEPASVRGENIFEIIAPSGFQSEEVVEEEEEDKPEDDGVEYAVVTVDPDGQAHVLLNAETIIDDEVVVLGQEEEVETEGVEADAISNEVIDSEMNDSSEVIESEVIDSEIVSSEVIDKPEEEPQHDVNLIAPEPESDLDKSNEGVELEKETTEVETEAPQLELQVETEPPSDPDKPENTEPAPDTEAPPLPEPEVKAEMEQPKVKSFAEELEAVEAAQLSISQLEEVEKMETEQMDQEVEASKEEAAQEESEDKETLESKAESTDGAQSDGSNRTPSRRSTRMRIRKEEEVKDKPKKREPKPAVVGKIERKSKDSLPKTPIVRRHSGKRAGSPVNTPASSKRSKMISKTPASPGRSAAPAEYKPSGGLPLDTIEPAVAGPAKQDVIPTPLKIGFLGLGIMGTGMVANLLKSGHEVTVWNRTANKCREFMKEGALKGNTPAEVVAACDVTYSCVSDPAAVKDLVFGNCGVLQGIQPGKGYIEMSTIDPDTVADVHEAITSQGGRFLEAPVVGSRGPANTGQLVILAAGDRTLYEDCYSCFEAMGKKTFFLGETTSGCKMKLVVNMLMGTCVAGLAESLALADKVGLDQDALLQILDLSVMSCPLIRAKGQAIMMSRFEPQFPLQHQQKDMRLSINMADSVDQPLHVATAVNELFKKAKAKGYSQHDMCAVYRAADM